MYADGISCGRGGLYVLSWEQEMQVNVIKCLERFTNDAATILAGNFIQKGAL